MVDETNESAVSGTQQGAVSGVSFEEARSELLAAMMRQCGAPVKNAVVPFRGNDVPKFVAQLNDFIGKSGNSMRIVR